MDSKLSVFEDKHICRIWHNDEWYFSMLGEQLTTEATRKRDAQGFPENVDAAKEGGTVAGRAREDAEKTLGIKVVSSGSYLESVKKKKRIEQK